MSVARDAALSPAGSSGPAIEWETADCPLCGGRQWSKVLEAPDVEADGRGPLFAVVRCEACGLCFTNPRPSPASIGQFYPADYGPHQRVGLSPARRRRAIRHLEKGRVVIFGAGTGNPYFTTDTAAVLRAAEIGADAVLKATQVDGVYSADPKSNPAAEFYPQLSYDRVIDERLEVIDLSAVDLCQRNDVTIVVFNLHKSGNMKRIVRGETIGTVIAQSS